MWLGGVMSDEKPRRFDWLRGGGAALLLLGVIQAVNGRPMGAVVALVGVLLVCTSVIRAAIEKGRR